MHQHYTMSKVCTDGASAIEALGKVESLSTFVHM